MVKQSADSTEDDYKKSGFGQTLGLGESPVLLVIDMVMAYFEPSSPLYAGVEAELRTTQALVKAARSKGVPVIWTNVEYEPGGLNGGHFYRKIEALKVFDRGSPLGSFPPDLKPVDGELVLTKQYPSAFFGTPLASHLTAIKADTVLVTGVTTSGCVRASTLDALQYGFAPIVVEDACGDRDADIQRANIFDLGAKYADIMQASDVIAAL